MEVHIFDGEVLSAVFINDSTGDSLELRIATKSRFDDIETGTVFYRPNSNSSYTFDEEFVSAEIMRNHGILISPAASYQLLDTSGNPT